MVTSVAVRRSGPEMLSDYGKVPMFVNVTSRLRLEHMDDGLMGLRLVEEPVDPPYVKSYEDPKDAPLRWADKWDLSSWGLFAAREEGRVIGGSVVAYRTNGRNELEGRDDVAVLWDIRVHPRVQRSGIGSLLFEQAKIFAQERGDPEHQRARLQVLPEAGMSSRGHRAACVQGVPR